MNRLSTPLFLLVALLFFHRDSDAQQYKLRQSTSISGMNMESTIYVKGMRKRTETGGMMGMPAPPVTIEQCDLQRTIKLNDKKKLYFIETFGQDDVIDDDVKPAANSKTKPVTPARTEKGGTIHMWYNITDTGERKKMNGFIARHVWTTQKIKPSADACLKDSMIIKTDGWYIDLPQFNCLIRYAPSTSMSQNPKQTECKDKYVTHRSGKGKLGFALTEKRTMIMGNSGMQTSEFSTSLETLEFSTMKLDSMLFEIPPGYTQAMKESELEEKMDMQDMINAYKNKANNENPGNNLTQQKKEGMIRVGVYEPKGDGQVQTSSLQQYMVGTITSGNIEAIAITTEEEAITYNCNYTLTTDITKIKSGSKVGGLLKAIKNTDPNAASSFSIDATLVLKPLSGGVSQGPQTVSGKYEGKVDDAARKAMDEGSRMILKLIK